MTMRALRTNAAVPALMAVLLAAPAIAQVPNVTPPGTPARSYLRPQAVAPGMPPQGVAPQGVAPPVAIPQHLSTSTEEAIDQQTRGDFPVMERAPSLPLGTLQRAWDRPQPAAGQAAPAVVHYMWHPDFVMPIRTRDFMVTSIILPAWETVSEFYLGDPLVFEARQVRGNAIAVRSRNAGADSNLTVIGASSNIYNFYIRSETWNSSQIPDLTIYVDASQPYRGGPAGESLLAARFGDQGDASARAPYDSIGPGPGAAAAAADPSFKVPDYIRRIAFRPDSLQFDMKMYAETPADAEIAPERVFHDGLFTYFDFGDRADTVARPVVHLLVDGVDTVVNTRTSGPNGSILIAEAVGDFTLRNGQRVLCVRWEGRPPVTAAVTMGSRGEFIPPPPPPDPQPAVQVAPAAAALPAAAPPAAPARKEANPQLEVSTSAEQTASEPDFFTRLVNFFGSSN